MAPKTSPQTLARQAAIRSTYAQPNKRQQRFVFMWVAAAAAALVFGMMVAVPSSLIGEPSATAVGIDTAVKAGTSQAVMRPFRWCQASKDDAVRRLQLQMAAQGANVSRVSLGSFNGLRGLRTARPIGHGEVLLSVPLSQALSITTFTASAVVAPLVSSWAAMEDGDQWLEVLALLYEAVVVGSVSPWASYLCTLPIRYSLPVVNSDPWAEQLLLAMPELHRLITKRRQQLAEMLPRLLAAMRELPGGASAVDAMSEAQAVAYVTWAYSAAKTRSLSIDLEEVPASRVGLPSELSWIPELGVLVPLLDLANHAHAGTANAGYAVRVKGVRKPRKSSEASSAPPPSSGVSFQLLALRDIPAGEEVRFSYLPDEEEGSPGPHCHDRWLLEYGFVLEETEAEEKLWGHRRDCHAFNVSARDVTAAVLQLAAEGSVSGKSGGVEGVTGSWDPGSAGRLLAGAGDANGMAHMGAVSEHRQIAGAGRTKASLSGSRSNVAGDTELDSVTAAVASGLRGQGLPDWRTIRLHAAPSGAIHGALEYVQWLTATMDAVLGVSSSDSSGGEKWASIDPQSESAKTKMCERVHMLLLRQQSTRVQQASTAAQRTLHDVVDAVGQRTVDLFYRQMLLRVIEGAERAVEAALAQPFQCNNG